MSRIGLAGLRAAGGGRAGGSVAPRAAPTWAAERPIVRCSAQAGTGGPGPSAWAANATHSHVRCPGPCHGISHARLVLRFHRMEVVAKRFAQPLLCVSRHASSRSSFAAASRRRLPRCLVAVARAGARKSRRAPRTGAPCCVFLAFQGLRSTPPPPRGEGWRGARSPAHVRPADGRVRLTLTRPGSSNGSWRVRRSTPGPCNDHGSLAHAQLRERSRCEARPSSRRDRPGAGRAPSGSRRDRGDRALDRRC
jgi:hypothetical protein